MPFIKVTEVDHDQVSLIKYEDIKEIRLYRDYDGREIWFYDKNRNRMLVKETEEQILSQLEGKITVTSEQPIAQKNSTYRHTQ